MATTTLPRLIPGSPFHFFSELIHKNIQQWSKELLDYFEAVDPFGAQFPSDASAHLNQAALLASLQGKSDLAFDLCHTQIKWMFDRIPARKMDANDFMGFFQPWVNIGRLHTINRDYDEAASHFRMIEKVKEENELDLIYDSIDSAKVLELFSEGEDGRELKAFMHSNHAEGMFMVFMKMHQYAEAIDFMKGQSDVFNDKDLEEIKKEFEDIRIECTLIAMEQKGEYGKAIDLINSYKPGKPISKLILLYHLAMNYHLVGDYENAFKYTLRLSGYMQKATKARNFRELKKLLLQTGKLCKALDMHRYSLQLNQLGYELSSELEDQRFELQYAMEIHDSFMLPADEQGVWGDRMRALLATNAYIMEIPGKYLHMVDKETIRNDYFQEMYARIQEKFAA